MIDQRLLRENPNLIAEGLKSRGVDIDLIALQNGLSPNKLLENFKQELMIRYWNLGIGQSELVSGKRFSRSLNLANQTRDITFTRLDF